MPNFLLVGFEKKHHNNDFTHRIWNQISHADSKSSDKKEFKIPDYKNFILVNQVEVWKKGSSRPKTFRINESFDLLTNGLQKKLKTSWRH